MYIRTSVFVSFETITTRPIQFKKGLLNPFEFFHNSRVIRQIQQKEILKKLET